VNTENRNGFLDKLLLIKVIDIVPIVSFYINLCILSVHLGKIELLVVKGSVCGGRLVKAIKKVGLAYGLALRKFLSHSVLALRRRLGDNRGYSLELQYLLAGVAIVAGV
jgi:hypothetical protein